jgi:methanogenic corrinoid protein MtbC1
VAKKHKVVWVGSTPTTSITAKERKQVAKRLEKEGARLGKIYPELQGKVVDFITHGVSDGTLYVSVRFADKTNFSIRYAAEMFVVGVDLSDWKTGNMDMIREYMKPIPK